MPRHKHNTQPRGDVIPMFFTALGSFPAMIGIIEGVKYARGHEWLADMPQWANPFEHINNVATEILPQMVTVAAMVAAAEGWRATAPTHKKIAALGLLASVAYQGVGELPQTQKLVMDMGIFESSSPDMMDFAYGSLAAVGCYAVNRRTIGHYGQTQEQAMHKQAMYGPTSFRLVAQPDQFTSIAVPLPGSGV